MIFLPLLLNFYLRCLKDGLSQDREIRSGLGFRIKFLVFINSVAKKFIGVSLAYFKFYNFICSNSSGKSSPSTQHNKTAKLSSFSISCALKCPSNCVNHILKSILLSPLNFSFFGFRFSVFHFWYAMQLLIVISQSTKKDTRTTPLASNFIVDFEHISHVSSVSIVNFE